MSTVSSRQSPDGENPNTRTEVHIGTPGFQAERQWLAREVHDRIGQPLTALKLIIDRLDSRGEETSELLQEASALVTEMQTEVRRLCVGLQSTPYGTDLVGTLELIFARNRQHNHLNVIRSVELEGSIAISAEINQAIIRIVQEALTNIGLHASVGEAAIKIWSEGGEVIIQVEDDGVGFDPGNIHPYSFGLARMQETARLAGGSLSVESAPGAGTLVTARFSLDGKGHDGD